MDFLNLFFYPLPLSSALQLPGETRGCGEGGIHVDFMVGMADQ